MTELGWNDSLSAPRSLATRDQTAVAVVEDPGILDIRPAGSAADIETACAELIGIELPVAPWAGASRDGLRIVWIGERRWRVIGEREKILPIVGALNARVGAASLCDLTGAFACFRIVGATAHEILMRVCPLNLDPVEVDAARGTSLAGVQTLLIREGMQSSWLALAPRSFAEHVAEALVEAARTPGQLALFEPAEPPPV